jgi:DNA-binding protein HU-beta
MPIQKSQFIQELAAKLSITQSEAERFVNTFINFLYVKVAGGDKVNFSGFGQFSVSHRAAREGVNPRTKDRIKIPELNTPKFKAGEGFKEAVRLRP